MPTTLPTIQTTHLVMVSAALLKVFKIWYTYDARKTRQMLAASWGEPEVQQLNNALVHELYNTIKLVTATCVCLLNLLAGVSAVSWCVLNLYSSLLLRSLSSSVVTMTWSLHEVL